MSTDTKTLIEAARELLPMETINYSPEHDYIAHLADALEAAEQRADALAAVVEKVRAYAESIPRTRDRDVNPGLSNRSWLTAQDVLGILATDPTDALREHDARVWEEGRESVALDLTRPLGEDGRRPMTPNPYQQAKRVLMTHPHDGHDLRVEAFDRMIAQVRAEALREFADEYERIHDRIEPTGETPDYWRGAEDAHEYIVGRLRSAADFQLHGHEGADE